MLVDVGDFRDERASGGTEGGRGQLRFDDRRLVRPNPRLAAQREGLLPVIERAEEGEALIPRGREIAGGIGQGPAHFGIGEAAAEEVSPVHRGAGTRGTGGELGRKVEGDFESIGLVGRDDERGGGSRVVAAEAGLHHVVAERCEGDCESALEGAAGVGFDRGAGHFVVFRVAEDEGHFLPGADRESLGSEGADVTLDPRGLARLVERTVGEHHGAGAGVALGRDRPIAGEPVADAERVGRGPHREHAGVVPLRDDEPGRGGGELEEGVASFVRGAAGERVEPGGEEPRLRPRHGCPGGGREDVQAETVVRLFPKHAEVAEDDESLGRGLLGAGSVERCSLQFEQDHARLFSAEDARPIEVGRLARVDGGALELDLLVGELLALELPDGHRGALLVVPLVLLEEVPSAGRLVVGEQRGLDAQRGEVDRSHGQHAASAEDLRHGEFGEVKARGNGREAHGAVPGAVERGAGRGDHVLADGELVVAVEGEFAAGHDRSVADLPGESLGRRVDGEEFRGAVRVDVGSEAAAELEVEGGPGVDVVGGLHGPHGERGHHPERQFVGRGELLSAYGGRKPGRDDELPSLGRGQRGRRADDEARGDGVALVALPGVGIGELSPPQVPVLGIGRDVEVVVGARVAHIGGDRFSGCVNEAEERRVGRDRQGEGELDLDVGRDGFVVPHAAVDRGDAEGRGGERCLEARGDRLSGGILQPVAETHRP